MFRIFALAKRKAGLSPDEFRTIYETRHAALVAQIAPPPGAYLRHYIDFADVLNVNADDAGFDVITEMTFADRAEFERWGATLAAPGNGERIAADQADFIDMASFRICVVRGE